MDEKILQPEENENTPTEEEIVAPDPEKPKKTKKPLIILGAIAAVVVISVIVLLCILLGGKEKPSSNDIIPDSPNNSIVYSEGVEFGFNADGACFVFFTAACNDTDVVVPSVSPDGDIVTEIYFYSLYGGTSFKSVTIPDSVTSIVFDDDSIYTMIFGHVVINSIIVDENNRHYKSIDGNLYSKDGKTLIRHTPGKANTHFTIPDGVTSISNYAFSDCLSLVSITIPDGVTSIGKSAISSTAYYNDESNWENGVLYLGKHLIQAKSTLSGAYTVKSGTLTIAGSAFADCESLTSVTIPDSVTTIGEYAFSDCDSLTSVTIGDSVTTIGDSAFEDCESLTSVTIPDSVTTIGDYAFRYCPSLTGVTIGNGVTTIGESAFYGCSSLMSISVDANNRHYKSIDGNLYSKDGKTLILYAMGKTDTHFTIPDSVTTIGYAAFLECTSLTSVTIPDNVTTIDDSAFYYCPSLTSIVVNENNQSYKSINGNLYTKDGKTLIKYAIGKTDTHFTIPDSVTTISYAAFADCKNLTGVTVPDSVTTIGDYAFADCENLTGVTIGNGVTTIGDFAFYYCTSLTGVTIPDSVTTIGYAAFAYCENLTGVTIPDSVTTIGYAAFAYCENLTGVTIGDSVTTIGERAFEDCESLTSITIGKGVENIDVSVFSGCTSLMSISVDTNNRHYKSIDGNLYSKDGKTLILYAMGKTDIHFTIPDGVKSIDAFAFNDCTRLRSITIPTSVKSIGEAAFQNCINITNVYYKGSASQWAGINISLGNEYITNINITYNYGK